MALDLNLTVALLGAFFHALLVVIGIYIAINSRLTKLEARMEIVWGRLTRWLDRNGA